MGIHVVFTDVEMPGARWARPQACRVRQAMMASHQDRSELRQLPDAGGQFAERRPLPAEVISASAGDCRLNGPYRGDVARLGSCCPPRPPYSDERQENAYPPPRSIFRFRGSPDGLWVHFGIARTELLPLIKDMGHSQGTYDLYRIGFDPILAEQGLVPVSNDHPARIDVAKAQDDLRAADVLTVIYPLWWMSMPAMMKGYIDRVFARGFAYESRDGVVHGLLSGKKAVLVTISGAPLPLPLLVKSGNWNAMQVLRHACLPFRWVRIRLSTCISTRLCRSSRKRSPSSIWRAYVPAHSGISARARVTVGPVRCRSGGRANASSG